MHPKSQKRRGQKIPVSWTIGVGAYNILHRFKRTTGRSMSQIVERLILTGLIDNKTKLIEEKRAHAKRMNEIDREMRLIEATEEK